MFPLCFRFLSTSWFLTDGITERRETRLELELLEEPRRKQSPPRLCHSRPTPELSLACSCCCAQIPFRSLLPLPLPAPGSPSVSGGDRRRRGVPAGTAVVWRRCSAAQEERGRRERQPVLLGPGTLRALASRRHRRRRRSTPFGIGIMRAILALARSTAARRTGAAPS